VGSATDLPRVLAEDSAFTFTHVLALDCAYHFTPSRSAFFQQSFDALEPGGCLALCDILPCFPAAVACLPSVSAQHRALSLPWRLGLRALSSACAIPLSNLHSLPVYRSSLEAAGFKDVAFEDITEHMFAGFARFVSDSSARSRQSDGAPITRRMQATAWLRFRVTASVLDWLATRSLVGCYLVRATKPHNPRT